MTRFFWYLATAGLIAVSLESSVVLAQQQGGNPFAPPPVPIKLEVPAGNTLFLKGEAKGTQNYVCLPSADPTTGGFAFKLFTPEATLFLPLNFTGNEFTHQIITHFFSPNPNPLDNGAIRATWQSSSDTSAVWAATVPDGVSNDPNFVKPGAVAWLLLKNKGYATWGHGRRRSLSDYFRAAAKYLRRSCAYDWLQPASTHRNHRIRAIHGRLLLLQSNPEAVVSRPADPANPAVAAAGGASGAGRRPTILRI